MAEAVDRSSGELRVGLRAEFVREISAEDVTAFAVLSGDQNPLHTDAAYARQTNYGRRIVHGAFQVGLASALAGMHLPGRRVVLGSVQSRFPAPLYFPCKVLVRGEIVSWFAAAQSGVLRVRIEDQASSQLTAELQMSFGLHEERSPAPAGTVNASAPGERPLLLVTGANGAVGREIVALYTGRFDVLACMRPAAPSQTLATAETSPERASESIELDLESDHWEELASRAVGERPVYGIVHAAWPGAPKGGLLGLELEAVRRQVDFGALVTIRLARWLASHSSGGARLVLLGSTAASLHPELALSGYALGKSVLEHVVRLLAPELAPRAITINAVLPSYMPLGMNQSKSARATLLEAARVPLGRVCTISDVAAAIDYLLAPAASFFSGQLLPLSGGRL